MRRLQDWIVPVRRCIQKGAEISAETLQISRWGPTVQARSSRVLEVMIRGWPSCQVAFGTLAVDFYWFLISSWSLYLTPHEQIKRDRSLSFHQPPVPAVVGPHFRTESTSIEAEAHSCLTGCNPTWLCWKGVPIEACLDSKIDRSAQLLRNMTEGCANPRLETLRPWPLELLSWHTKAWLSTCVELLPSRKAHTR